MYRNLGHKLKTIAKIEFWVILAASAGAGAWLLLGYLAFLSAAAYSIWSLLLRRYPPSRIAVFTFANPVFGVFLSAWILGESAELNLTRCLLALVLVGLGIWIVNRRAD